VTRVALVGCGRWGRFIARDLRALGCEVVAVARSDESRARAVAAGVCSIVARLDALPAVDAAVVATPVSTHARIVVALLDRHIPIFVEKPLTSDERTARSLLERARDRVFGMDKWRYHPGIRVLADLASARALGRVLGLRTLRMGWLDRAYDVDAAFHLMPHDLAICLEVLGFLPEPRAAVAEVAGGHAMGYVATLGADPFAVIEVSERRRRHFREVRLFCEEGTATLTDAYATSIVLSRHADVGPPPPVKTVPVSGEMPLLAELAAFVAHVQGEGPPPRSGLDDAVAIVAHIARIRALAGMEPVREPWPDEPER
jgi:predicted dehydrogenase